MHFELTPYKNVSKNYSFVYYSFIGQLQQLKKKKTHVSFHACLFSVD